jgi:hypothetical protein
MRTRLIAIILFVLAGQAMAQVEKGDLIVAVNGSFSKTGDYSTFGLINAKIGRFLTQNVEMGIKPQLQFGDGFTGTGLGVYGTYNFLTSNGKLMPYLGAELSMFTQTPEEGDSFDQTDAGLYAGTKLFMTEVVNVDFGLNISSNLTNSADIDLGTTVMFNIGIGFIIGKAE